MDTQSNLSAQLNQQQNAAKMTNVAGPIGGVAGGAVGKLASAAISKLVGDTNLLLWLIALSLDGYGFVASWIAVLTFGVSELVEVPAEIGAGFACRSLLKDHLSQSPELNKWIFIVTGLELVPFLDILPWWTMMMIYASYKIKQAKEQAQAEQETKQKQAQIAQRRQAEWAAVA